MKHRKHGTQALESIAASLSQGNATERNTARVAPKDEAVKPGLWLGVVKSMNVSEARSKTARRARRSYPIRAYVGPNGGGKSLAMVADALESLRAGRTVLSTVRLTDPETGEDHPSYVKFEHWDQLLEARDCDVLMDEMVGIASSRESQKLDHRVQNILVQLRRRNVTLSWSAPNWARADKIVREVTQAVTECRGSFADHSLRRGDTKDGEAVALWAPKRMFTFRTYDTVDFEEWTAGKREKVKPLVTEWFYGPGSEVFRSYDTMDAVSMVAGITPEGRCDICDGRVTIPTCKGHGSEALPDAPRRARRAAAVVVHDELELTANL